MKLALPCYTCSSPIEGGKNYFATFYGKPQQVCTDCAKGIHYGSQILKANGVSGEHINKDRK